MKLFQLSFINPFKITNLFPLRLLINKSIELFTVFHRSIAAATNYFVLQVPEATIRGRRLFEGGVNKIILSYNYFYYPRAQASRVM